MVSVYKAVIKLRRVKCTSLKVTLMAKTNNYKTTIMYSDLFSVWGSTIKSKRVIRLIILMVV